MERKTTKEIDEMELILEQGRQSYRDGVSLDANPYKQARQRGYWRLGWFQVRDQENP